MKKLIFLALSALIIAACGAPAQRSDFWKHESIYKNWEHMKFSWSGYKRPSAESLEKSNEQNWWGDPVTGP